MRERRRLGEPSPRRLVLIRLVAVLMRGIVAIRASPLPQERLSEKLGVLLESL